MARGERFGDRVRAFARPWELASFLWVPLVLIAFAFWHELHARDALQDFGIFRRAARLVMDGTSPYAAPNAHALAGFDKFVYPPAAAVLFAPLAEIPVGAARVVMLAGGLLCVLGALRLLGVADWRCYGVASMSAPVVNSLALGALSSFLFLGAAIVWRYRDRPALAGTAAALTALLKVFLWPLAVWLAATRRTGAFVRCMLAGLVLLVGGWALIDFAGLTTYPRMLRVLTDLEGGVSYGPLALLHVSDRTRSVLSILVALLVVVAVVVAARTVDGDRRSFAIAIVGALVATPILWLHYLVLLFIPLALYRPRLSPLWFAPLALWAVPSTNSHGVTWHILLALTVIAAVTLGTLVSFPEPRALRRSVTVNG